MYRIIGLLILLMLLFKPHSGYSQPEIWRDSIDIILKSDVNNKNSIEKLNFYISEIWKAERVSDSTISQALDIVEKARHTGYEIGLADALINLVRCYLNRYESSKSLEHALEANKIYEKYNDKSKMAYTKMQLGVIYYTQNNFQKSLEYYIQAISNFRSLNDSLRISTLLYLCGINNTKLKDYKEANTYFKKALALKTVLKDYQGLAECNIGMGELKLAENKPDSALLYIENSTLFMDSLNDKYGTAKSNLIRSKCYQMLNKYPEAFTYAESSHKIAMEIDARELIVDANEQLYKLNQATGNFKNAYQYLFNYMTMRDSIFNEKTSRSFARLETDYVLEKKQSEILLLENENRNRTILLRASVTIGILFLLLAFLFYNRFQIKQKANNKLEKAYKELEMTQKQLVQQEKLASLGQLTAGIAHEIKNPLNFVNNFSALSNDLINEYVKSDDEETKSEIIKDLQLNIQKINSHGNRADSIVTKMLEHSRTGIRDKKETDINKLCNEDLHLAYKAIQLGNPGFNCEIDLDLDKNLPKIKAVTQEISRVLLNIINNAFYSILEKQKSSKEFQPHIYLRSATEANNVVISIRDNGNGIPKNITENIFQPFFTTKPPGEGTGLGLSISYDIIKAHGGNIIARNHSSGGAEFIISLPV